MEVNEWSSMSLFGPQVAHKPWIFWEILFVTICINNYAHGLYIIMFLAVQYRSLLPISVRVSSLSLGKSYDWTQYHVKLGHNISRIYSTHEKKSVIPYRCLSRTVVPRNRRYSCSSAGYRLSWGTTNTQRHCNTPGLLRNRHQCCSAKGRNAGN